MRELFEMIPILFLMLIPIIAIIGGITVGIMKTMNRQRFVELAQKERIAAIERGIDPSQLPPLEIPPGLLDRKNNLTFEQRQLRSSQHLTIAGLIVSGFGIAMIVMLAVVESGEGAWAGGMIFLMVGLALLLSARVLRPRNGTGSGSGAS